MSENRAKNTLSRVSASTSWRGLCTDLGKALQIRIEREGDSSEILEPAFSSTSKPNIFFAAPRYAKKVSKAMLLGQNMKIPVGTVERIGIVTQNSSSLSTSK